MALTTDLQSILPWMTATEQKYPVHCRSEFPATELNSLASKIGRRDGYPSQAELLMQPWSQQFLNFLLNLLNDESTTIRVKLATLLILVELSKTPDFQQREQLLLPIALQLDVGFANMLEDKVKAAQEFGTMLGRQHEYVVVLLMRCTRYILTGRDLLQDFFGGNRALFFQVTLGILKVVPYEVEIKVNALKCLYEVSLPQTYFSSNSPPSPTKAAGGSEENSATDFLDHMDTLLGVAIGCNALKTLCEIIQTLVKTSASGSVTAAAGGGISHGNLASCMRYFCLLYCNFFVFSSNKGNNGSQWRESMVTSNSVFLGDTLFDFMTKTAELFNSSTEGASSVSASDSSAFLLALEACSTCAALAIFGVKSQTVLSTLREKATTMTAKVLLALNDAQMCQGSQTQPALAVSSTVVLFAKLLQLQINADTLCSKNGKISPDAEGGASESGLPQKPTELQLFRCIVSQVGKLTDPQDMRLLSRLVVNCSSTLPLLAKKHKSFDIILDTVESYADKLGALQSAGPSTSSLGGETGDGSSDDENDDDEDDLDAALGELDQKTALLERNDSSATPTDRAPPCTMTTDDAPSTKVKKHKKDKKGSKEKKISKREKKEKRRAKESQHPAEYICQWSGALMKNPVQLPSGNWFELSALEEVIDHMGHVDPVTGEGFDSHLNVDNALQRKIQRYLFQLQMQHAQQQQQ